MMGGGFSIIFWIVLFGVVYYFFKEYNRSNHHRHDDNRHGGPGYKDRGSFDDKREIGHRIDEDNPEELARQRYAKGEISKEELRKILDGIFVTTQRVPAKYGTNRRNLDIKAIDNLKRYLQKKGTINAKLQNFIIPV